MQTEIILMLISNTILDESMTFVFVENALMVH